MLPSYSPPQAQQPAPQNWQAHYPTIGRQIGARYRRATSQSLGYGGNTNLIFPTRDYDTHNAYNTTTGVYTAQTSGIYVVKCSILTELGTMYAAGEAIAAYVQKNGGDYALIGAANHVNSGGASTYIHLSGDTDIWLDTGDTCNPYVYQAINSPSLGLIASGVYNWFSIRLDRYA